jgi:hypothetical protein
MNIADTLENIKIVSRKARLSDFTDDNPDLNNNNNNNNTNNNGKDKNDHIQKNQKEYGHKKRIKP